MPRKIKIMIIFGTRPEAIKMAPLIKELENNNHWFESVVVVTAQHREMLDQVLSIFELKPDYDMNIMKERQTLLDITKALERLDHIIKIENPDMVFVHGDTMTTFVGSLAAYYNRVSVGHVEAGLRTGNKYNPFPEEMNRRLTSVIADLHFAPTEEAADNLMKENKPKESIFVTGNTAIDALKTTVKSNYQHELLKKISNRKLILLTAHRRENLGEPMRNIFRAVKRLVAERTDVEVVYPVHRNPSVREIAVEMLNHEERIHLTEPFNVVDFHNFASRACLILTDSGGIQEEAPSLGVPVLVLREATERPEGIKAGTLKLAGTKEERIYQLATELLTNKKAYNRMAQASNPYGDGQASKRIVHAVLYFFGFIDHPPIPFT